MHGRSHSFLWRGGCRRCGRPCQGRAEESFQVLWFHKEFLRVRHSGKRGEPRRPVLLPSQGCGDERGRLPGPECPDIFPFPCPDFAARGGCLRLQGRPDEFRSQGGDRFLCRADRVKRYGPAPAPPGLYDSGLGQPEDGQGRQGLRYAEIGTGMASDGCRPASCPRP